MTDHQVISICSSHKNPSIRTESNPHLKKKRNLPGTPDPEAEVIALSPKTLMACNMFLCETCGKGFQRDQNLQLHRRGHNLPWKLKQRASKEVRKRVYVCPEKTCVHNNASRALGDLTGIKKHFCRKHGEKKWKCDRCSKLYAVHSDWKAHSKTCGTKEYKCDSCGTIFSRRDNFITHRAFCVALAEETKRFATASQMINHHFIGSSLGQPGLVQHFPPIFTPDSTDSDHKNMDLGRGVPLWMAQDPTHHVQDHMSKNVQEIMHPIGLTSVPINNSTTHNNPISNNINPLHNIFGNYNFTPNGPNYINLTNAKEVSVPSLFSSQDQTHQSPSDAYISATALLQRAARVGATTNISCRDGNKWCGLYGGSDDVEGSVNDHCALNQMEMHRPSKRGRFGGYDPEVMTRGETRDFLGVGVLPVCHPSSVNGWI